MRFELENKWRYWYRPDMHFEAFRVMYSKSKRNDRDGRKVKPQRTIALTLLNVCLLIKWGGFDVKFRKDGSYYVKHP